MLENWNKQIFQSNFKAEWKQLFNGNEIGKRFRKDFNSAGKVLWIKKNNKNYLNIPKAIFYYKNVYIFNDLLLFTAIKTDTLTAEVTAILNVAMSLKNAVEWKAVISNQ